MNWSDIKILLTLLFIVALVALSVAGSMALAEKLDLPWWAILILK